MLRRRSIATPVAAIWVLLLATVLPLAPAFAQGWSEEGVIEAPAPGVSESWIDPECGCPAGVRVLPGRDGACFALDPDRVRDRYRASLRVQFGLEPPPAEGETDAEIGTATRSLSAWPLEHREGAVRELSSDAAIRDPEAAAAAIAGIAERWGLPEADVRVATSHARERLILRLQDEGMLDADAARCLFQRLRLHFRAPTPAAAGEGGAPEAPPNR